MAVPRVSVGLPVRNGERFLARALDSLLAQDHADLEIVVSDNASDDATPEICRQYARQDSRVHYQFNESNIGLVANFNRAFELARGPLFKWATHDDWMEPGFVGRCVAALEADPSLLAACSAVIVHDEHGNQLETWQPPRDYVAPRASTRCHRLLWTLGETYPIFGVFRREALTSTGPMGRYLGADRVLLASVTLRGGVHVDPAALYHYTYYRPAGRTYSVYNDPAAHTMVPMRTWRLISEHLKAVRGADLPPAETVLVGADVLARFGIRDARRLAAEAYHAGRAHAQRLRLGRAKAG